LVRSARRAASALRACSALSSSAPRLLRFRFPR
jgi:hypothetical protein